MADKTRRGIPAWERKIGAAVRVRRLAKGISQEKLADEIGVTFQQVQKYEKGINRIAVTRLYRIAEVLDVPILALIPLGKHAR